MTALEKPPAALKKRILSAKQLQQPNNLLGLVGEERAKTFLQQKGYRIIGSNISFQGFEIDIIAQDPATNVLVFCEVKSRSSNQYGHPSQAVDWKKMLSMQKMAAVYCQKHRVQMPYRFDVISVLPHSIQHFENITV